MVFGEIWECVNADLLVNELVSVLAQAQSGEPNRNTWLGLNWGKHIGSMTIFISRDAKQWPDTSLSSHEPFFCFSSACPLEPRRVEGLPRLLVDSLGGLITCSERSSQEAVPDTLAQWLILTPHFTAFSFYLHQASTTP